MYNICRCVYIYTYIYMCIYIYIHLFIPQTVFSCRVFYGVATWPCRLRRSRSAAGTPFLFQEDRYLVTLTFRTPGKVNTFGELWRNMSIFPMKYWSPMVFLLLSTPASQVSPNVSQMSLRCFSDASEMLPRCFPNVSQTTCSMISPLGFLFPDFSFMTILHVG